MSRTFRFESLEGENYHHFPPKHKDKKPRFRRHDGQKLVSTKLHAAYHMLFGNARSFEDAVEILRHDWWSNV